MNHWRKHVATLMCSVTTLAFPPKLGAQQKKLSEYKPAAKVFGTIRVCGSPQMGELLKLYERDFARFQSHVQFENDLEDTTTAVHGVVSGKADIGLLGREIWQSEEQEFKAVRGHAPLVIDIATGSYDVPKATFALMVFVPAANPIASLSLQQLERIFSAKDRPISTWGELGLKGRWAERPIHLYGFAADNDKARIFRQLVFHESGAWTPALKEFRNAGNVDAGELIVKAIASDPDAIGISNVHYGTAAVKMLGISTGARSQATAPTRKNVMTRRYPLSRAVYMVADSSAKHSLSPAVREFLHYVLSRQGQKDVVLEGNYLPLPIPVAQRESNELNSEGK